MDWKEIIEQICAHNGISVYRLSKMTGITESYLGKLKLNRRHSPSIEKAMKILQYHPASWLIEHGKIYKRGNENEGWVEV